MRIPRDVGGEDLAKRLAKLGYEKVRKSGSHIRLTRSEAPEHHLTVPSHRHLRLGTISSILGEVAERLGKTKDEIVRELFT